MASLGSFAEGAVGMQLDLQNVQLNQAKLAEAPIKLAQEKIELQKDQMQLARQVRMLSLMQNIKPPSDVNNPDALSDVWNQVAMIQLESGMPDEALKTANLASEIQNRGSLIDARTYRMQNDRMSKFANVLSAAPDTAAGYSAALTQMMQDDPSIVKNPRFQQLMKEPWQPGKVQALLRSTLTAKEQAEVDYRRKAGEHAEAAAAVDEARVPLVKAQTRLANDRDVKLKKEGVAAVKAADLKAITDQVAVDYPGAIDQDVRVRSRPLAEEMVKMMREQHLSQSEAAKRVYERARTEGVFAGLRVAPVIRGSKPGAPLALPTRTSGMTIEQYRKKLQVNQWYPEGLWTGTEFISEDEALKRQSGDEALELGEEDE
jgi:hypothetical protein